MIVERIENLIKQENVKNFDASEHVLTMDARTLFDLRCKHPEALNNVYKGIDIDVTHSKGLLMLSRKQKIFGCSDNKYYYRNYSIERISKGFYNVYLNYKLLMENVYLISTAKALVLHHDKHKNFNDFNTRKSA